MPEPSAVARVIRLKGPWITLALVVVLQLTSDTPLGLPNPPALLVLAVVYSAFEGGLRPGLVSAAIAWAYLPVAFSMPGRLFEYTDADLRRVVVWAFTLPALVLMVGVLRRAAGRAATLAEANADLERQIAERRRAEAELRRAEERLREAVTAGNVGLWDWDVRSGVVQYSAEWKRQLGYEPHELTDDLSEWSRRLHPDDAARAQESMHAYLQGTRPRYEIEFRLRHRDGSYRNILSRGTRVLDAEGTPVRMVGSHLDLTDHTWLKAQLQHAQKMESVGRLAGGVAHDFNNLLTVINATADLGIQRLRPDDPLFAELTEIRHAGERAASLTRQLLAFSRSQIVAPEVVCFNVVVGRLRTMLARLIGEHIELVVDGDPDLGAAMADPSQVEQVVMNLVVNARDAMPSGGRLTIATRNVDDPQLAPGPHVMLEVTDTGAGMDEAVRAHIFEPFFTTKEAGKGTGLGLATVYGIVQQAGGLVLVDSEPGRGSRFRVLLPRVPDVTQPPPRAGEPLTRGTETILVVEDEPMLLRLARRILEGAGYSVLTAATGAEALALLERHDGALDLMLSDVVMPGIGGLELAERARRLRPDLPVLFASGYTSDAVLRTGVEDRSANFIGKPYTVDELTRKVRDVLDG